MAKFYKVGGAVRDEFLGLKSKDIDYAVETESFDSLRTAILDRGGEIFLETPKFVTIRANVPGFGACDFVLCRKDGSYSDGRHPDSVAPGTIYDDLARRDFTVNAMARAEDGTFIDPHSGYEDLMNHRLRCVGKAEDRFSEDGLRMLRAIRFAITKGLYHINKDIDNCLIDEEFFKPRLRGVSINRVREELTRCFQHDTWKTLTMLTSVRWYKDLGRYLFNLPELWLKPTLESR